MGRGPHKRTGGKNLGGCPTQSPLFTNIFARPQAKFCPSVAHFRKFIQSWGATASCPPPASYAYGSISCALWLLCAVPRCRAKMLYSSSHDNSMDKRPSIPKRVKIDDYGKDGGPHITQCMIGKCPLATHSYQNLQLQHKILTTATIDLGRRNFIMKSTRILLGT